MTQPQWATGPANETIQPGAMLATRDGRVIGNAVVLATDDVLGWTVITDQGGTVFLSQDDIAEKFFPPEWVLDLATHQGVTKAAAHHHLRTEFAKHAMGALLPSRDDVLEVLGYLPPAEPTMRHDIVATAAFAQADAMMRARDIAPTPPAPKVAVGLRLLTSIDRADLEYLPKFRALAESLAKNELMPSEARKQLQALLDSYNDDTIPF